MWAPLPTVDWPRVVPLALSAQVYLERVQSSPQMGVTSAFQFGRGYGTIEVPRRRTGSITVVFLLYQKGRDSFKAQDRAIDDFTDNKPRSRSASIS